MRVPTRNAILLLAAATALLALLAACAGTASSVRVHPEELTEAPVCSRCHDQWQGALDHGIGFDRSHRFAAGRDQQVCESCHRPSFCVDCHAGKEELKPSDKYMSEPWREMPHRGDYLTQHRIDGRINPASCYRCHGRRNDWRCKECHR